MKISAVIIAKNEERKIARCLESLKGSSEVIVVDGFSTDRTVEIANAFGAKVVQRKFTGSFADERNAGMENTANDWVLHLDADEVVTKGFWDEVERKEEGEAVVYKFRRKNFFLGHSMDHGGFHHYIPNLVNKRFVKFEGDVHESPVYKGQEGIIDADIEHHPFDSISQFIDRQNRYTDIAAKDLFRKNGRMPDKDIKKEMVNRSLKLFWKSYIKKQGYKEGMYGLVFAILFAWINFLKWSKYWEMVKA